MASAAAEAEDPVADATTRPNVVVILADDISAEMLRAYGGSLALPTIERLSAASP